MHDRSSSAGKVLATQSPASRAELASLLASLAEQKTAHAACGARLSLNFGYTHSKPVVEIDMTRLNQVLDYPFADLTITVEAGMTLGDLNQQLSKHRQFLPIDARPESTIGGLLACNHSGSRRFGYGTLRDYVIGIEYLDAAGQFVHGGGKVVKNVAGYDLMKMSIGALGQFGIITTVTFKVLPMPEMIADLHLQSTVDDVSGMKRLVSQLSAWCRSTQTRPMAVDWSNDPAMIHKGDATYCARMTFAGDQKEVAWQLAQGRAEWSANAMASEVTDGIEPAWSQMADAGSEPEIKFMCRRSKLPELCERVARELPRAKLLAHCGNGILRVRQQDLHTNLLLLEWCEEGLLEDWLVTRLAPSNEAKTVHPNPWGKQPDASWHWAGKLKRELDPYDLCNPGRVFA